MNVFVIHSLTQKETDSVTKVFFSFALYHKELSLCNKKYFYAKYVYAFLFVTHSVRQLQM